MQVKQAEFSAIVSSLGSFHMTFCHPTGDTTVIGMPDLANKNLLFYLATPNGQQEIMPDHNAFII